MRMSENGGEEGELELVEVSGGVSVGGEVRAGRME